MAERVSRCNDYLSILLSEANPYEVTSCDSVARYSERNLDHPHFPLHIITQDEETKNEDQEDEATLHPQTHVENGRASLRRRRCGLGNRLTSRQGTAGLVDTTALARQAG